ncbi:hypothetical protein E2C01_086399 [Portunus trituberculatus]|uniref:Uncharacterized protein n=1 Tax=Portunus trituberculatus TaxID=210409 RepID=A0A5B7JEH6_PORTR|nr:hypothetical protein [Portunus trituberculatus]
MLSAWRAASPSGNPAPPHPAPGTSLSSLTRGDPGHLPSCCRYANAALQATYVFMDLHPAGLVRGGMAGEEGRVRAGEVKVVEEGGRVRAGEVKDVERSEVERCGCRVGGKTSKAKEEQGRGAWGVERTLEDTTHHARRILAPG